MFCWNTYHNIQYLKIYLLILGSKYIQWSTLFLLSVIYPWFATNCTKSTKLHKNSSTFSFINSCPNFIIHKFFVSCLDLINRILSTICANNRSHSLFRKKYNFFKFTCNKYIIFSSFIKSVGKFLALSVGIVDNFDGHQHQ